MYPAALAAYRDLQLNTPDSPELAVIAGRIYLRTQDELVCIGNASLTFRNIETFHLSLGSGNDDLILAGGDDTVKAGQGDDRILGMGGNDLLEGQWGARLHRHLRKLECNPWCS